MKNLLLLPTICLVLFNMTLAQTVQELAFKKKHLGSLTSNQKHTYAVALKKDQFCLVMVQQQGVDAMIKTFAPSGEMLKQFDSPNGSQGPEAVTIVSNAPGSYRLEVESIGNDSDKDNYTIELVRVEPKATKPAEQIDQFMSTLVMPGSAGASIAVAQGDKILFSKGYGLSNPEYDIPITTQSIFHIASVSKQFTAFAIALLADQGKISLDDDIRKYLTELPDFGHKITIKHLIHHTSGLRDQWNLLALAGWRLDDVITRNQVMRLMSHQKELNFEPGAEFSYCNTGYTFMGEIVSRVTGQSFSQWCSENIFQPLQMHSTLFYDDHEKIVKNRTYSFYEAPGGLKKSVLSYANAGATSLFTTAEDLTRWSNNFYTMKVGNAKVMKAMEERGILNKGDTLSYAFGQDLSSYKGLKTISHSGGDAGYRTFLLRFPKQQYSIVVLSNLASFNPGDVAYRIADIYLKDLLKEEVKKAEGPKVASGNVTVSEELLKLYVGHYELNKELIVSFRIENGQLVAQATGQRSIPLTASSETEFFTDVADIKIAFNKLPDNTVNQFTLTQNGQTVVAPRMKAFDPKSINLHDFEGTYYSPELETSYTLEVKNNALVANHIRHEPATMSAVDKDSFATTAWFMSRVEFTRDEKNAVTGMKISSGRVKNVKFVRR